MMAKINRITPEMVEQAVNDVKTSGHNKYFTQEYMDAHAFDPEDKPDFLLPKQDDTQSGGGGFVGMGVPEGTPDYTSIYYNTSTQDDANRNMLTNIIGQGLVTGVGTALKNIGESLSEPVTPDTYTDVYYNTATQNNAPNENLNALGGVITQGADAAYKALQTTTMYNAAGYAWDEEGRVIKAKQMGEFFHQDPAFFLNNEQSYIQAAKIMASYNIDSRVAPDVDKSDPVAFGQYLNEHYPELVGADLADFQMALRNIEDVKSIHSIGQAVKLAWALYATQAESADISRAAFLGKYGKYGTDYLPEEAIDRKNWLNEHYKKLRDMIPTLGEHPLLNILTQSGEQLGGMTEDTIKGAAIGGAAAAIAYSIPGVGATTAKSVFATGMKYGSMLGMFWRQVGDKYIEYASYQDENGRPLFTPDEARVRAAIETGLETGIEFYNYDDIMRALSGSGRVAIQNIVARNKGDKEAIIGGLKGYVASAAKSWAPRVKEEVLEEGEQSLVDSAMKAYMLNVERPNNKEEKPTLQGAAYDAADAMVQAVPAVVGMIAAGDVVSNVTAVRKVATIAKLHNKLSEEQVDNVVTLNTLKELKENQKVNKLFKKDPDLYKKTVKATMEDAGMPYVFVDTEMLLKEEGGEQLVNQLGKEIGMTDEEIKNVVDSKADLKVPTEIYCQVALPSQLADKAMTMTTSSANLNCEARVKDTVARVQKNIQELSRKDEEERQQVVNNIADNSGFTGAEKELAKEVMLDNPTDVQKGYKDAVKAAEDEVNSIIDPVVERLDKNSQIGDVNGGFRQVWWTDYFGKKTPTETEKRQFAYDVLTAKEPGDLTPVMGQMSEEDVAKWEQDGAEMKKRLDGLIKRRDILRGMADKMAKIDSVETSVTKGLTPEAYRVYRSTADTLGQSKNKDVAKSARFSAIIFARMCQRLADESVKQGKKVTAEDIASTIAINPNASEVVKGGHNQFAWHGSPYNFDKFTLDHIGEGEGQQVHGYGLYFAKNKSISQGYKDKLNKTDSNARLYKVDVPDTKNLLNEQKPFKSMSKGIKSKIKKAFESLTDDEKKTFAKTLIKDEYPSERERELKGERSPLARRLNFLTKIKDGNIGYAKYLDLHRKWLEKTFSLTDSEIDTLKDKDKGPVLAGKLLDEYNKSKGNEFKQIENELAKLQGEREERTRKARESLFDTLENDESVSDFPRYSGKDIYNAFAAAKGSPKLASQTLNDNGISGITYVGADDGRCFVVFNDNAVKIIEKYNQQQAAINGQTYRTQAGTFVNIFKTADASTFVHESAHVYLMQMGNLARNENASAQFRSDFMTVQRWLGNSDINDAINVKQHEKFARGFEAYLRNGQAPAPALRSVFTRFKTWLTQIYRDFVQLGGKPTKEIRDVMDRMLATKDEVDLAMKEQMVDDFERAGGLKGANPDVSSKWKEWYGKVREEAEAKVMAQAMKDLEAQQHADFDAMVEAERKNIEGDLMDLPLWKANAIVEDANGDESMLSAFGLTPEEYHKQLEEAGGSFDAAVKRQLDAFRQELESDAASADMISKAAKNAVQTAKYQEMLHGLEYKALEDAVNKMQDKQDQRVRSLVFETVKARRQQARDALAKLPIGEALNLPMWAKKLAQQQYDVSKLIGEKKWREALKAKGDQLMSAAVITEAGRMKARVDKITDDVKKHIATVQKGNDRLPADERYYYTHLAYLLGLSRVDGLQPAELKSLTDVFKGFAGQTAEEEAETVFPGWLENLVNSKDRIGWQSLTAPELEYVSKVMNALYKRGRTKENLNILTKDDGSVMTIAEAVDQLTDDINGHVTPDYRPDKQDLNRPIDKVKRQIHGAADFLGEYFHKLVTPLTLLQRMDGYEGKTGKGVTGHAIKWLYDPIMKATNKETLLKADFANKLTDILSVYGSEMDDIRNKAIYRFGDRILTKEQVMALALNTGTESNYARILDNEPLGKNWNPKSIDDRHGSVQDALTRVFRDALTEKDWNVIMRIWDLMSEHWADESQIKERTTGIPLGKVKTRDFEITTKDGKTIEVKGGYYPIAYDPKQSVKASNLETQDALKSMSPGALRMGQKKSFTKSRADAVTGRPLQLSFDVIPRKGGEMMHYIAFREAALDVSRIVNNKKFTAAVVDALGMESYKTLQSYAADVWAPPVQGNAWYDKVMQKVRTNTTTAVLAYRTSTMLLNAANAPLMIMYCGPGEFFSAFRKFYESPMKNFRFVNGLSPFMAERSERMDTNIRESYQAKHSGVTPLSINDKIMQNGFKLIGATDNMFAYPLWYAEYMRVLNEGINSGKKVEDIQQDAIAAGDRAVVRVIGSGDLKDLSPAQKGGELAKMLTMFYTFQNALYNMAANKFYAGREAARLKGAKGNTFITQPEFIVPMAHFLLCGVMLNSAIEMGIRGAMDAASGRDDDKEKNAAYWFKRFVQGSIENQTATVPILRDIWRPISNIIFEGKPMFSPSTKMTSAFDSFTRIVEGANTAEGYALGKKNLADMVRDGGRVITALAGAPDMIVDGASAALQYFLYDGGEHDLLDLMAAIAFDRKLPKPKKKAKKLTPYERRLRNAAKTRVKK